jgi:hypothetical protein
MKQEQKAKGKEEKEKKEQDSVSTKMKDTTSVIKEDDISPNVSLVPVHYGRWHSRFSMVIDSRNMQTYSYNVFVVEIWKK